MKTVSSHILKLTGKAELPSEVEMGHNYGVALSGSITATSLSDNEDGTFTKTYTFKPVKVEMLTPQGERLKLKDTRSKSQLFRARCWTVWKNGDGAEDFDAFYERLMNNLIQMAPEIVEMYGSKLSN